MQFVAERRIENGLQIVTPIFLNPPNCLYIKKDCKFFQSYEKSSGMQKKKSFFFSFPRRSNFGEAKINEKSSGMQKKSSFFFHSRDGVTSAQPKLIKKNPYKCRISRKTAIKSSFIGDIQNQSLRGTILSFIRSSILKH